MGASRASAITACVGEERGHPVTIRAAAIGFPLAPPPPCPDQHYPEIEDKPPPCPDQHYPEIEDEPPPYPDQHYPEIEDEDFSPPGSRPDIGPTYNFR